jgi:hypothetical protein
MLTWFSVVCKCDLLCGTNGVFVSCSYKHLLCLVVIDDERDASGFMAIVHLTCTKRTVRLTKDAVRRSWNPSLKDCMDSCYLLAKVSYQTDVIKHFSYSFWLLKLFLCTPKKSSRFGILVYC